MTWNPSKQLQVGIGPHLVNPGCAGSCRRLCKACNGPGRGRKYSQPPCTRKHILIYRSTENNHIAYQAWVRSEDSLDTVKRHVQPSCSAGVYQLLIKMINWEPIGSLAPNGLSYLFWIFFPCHSTRMWGSDSTRPVTPYFYFEKCSPYPDFADGVSEAFVVSGLTECYGIELSFVEVGHGALPLLLTERFGGFQGVLKCSTAKKEERAASSLDHSYPPPPLPPPPREVSCQQYFIWILTNVDYTEKIQNIAAGMSADQGSGMHNIHSIFNRGS